MSSSPPSCLAQTAGVPAIGGVKRLSQGEHANRARTLADQQAAIGQKRHAPGRHQPVGDDLDAIGVALARAHRSVGRAGLRPLVRAQRGARLAQVVDHRANLRLGQQRAQTPACPRPAGPRESSWPCWRRRRRTSRCRRAGSAPCRLPAWRRGRQHTPPHRPCATSRWRQPLEAAPREPQEPDGRYTWRVE